MLFEPVVGVALAALLLDERLTPIQVAGGLAVLGAALILQRSEAPGGRIVTAPAIEADDPGDPPATAAITTGAGPASAAARPTGAGGGR